MERLASSRPHAGFTLLELSIVLIIIGLLVGGVLVGRSLIRAAELRATITQIEQLQTAVRTFQEKYNALPGDIQAFQATAFGFATRTGGPGDGDGDGYISDCNASSSTTYRLGCETVFFWTDLSRRQVVSMCKAGKSNNYITIIKNGMP